MWRRLMKIMASTIGGLWTLGVIRSTFGVLDYMRYDMAEDNRYGELDRAIVCYHPTRQS